MPLPGEALFPGSVVDVLKTTFDYRIFGADASDGTVTPAHEVLRRPVRFTDPARTMGVYAMNWVPQEDSAEIGQNEPVLATYNFRIQNLIKHANEEEARSLYVADAKTVRAILYRDPTLGVALRSLSETVLSSTERLMRFGVRGQSYQNNEIRSQFTYLATTDFWVETEIVQL